LSGAKLLVLVVLETSHAIQASPFFCHSFCAPTHDAGQKGLR
jgi:hypothetical protein